ncbi:MAG: hypothetical protein QG657_2028 [Acidobacteriota bacterium]|nr:hypothetical protein [Acidobacteriota bacterium]
MDRSLAEFRAVWERKKILREVYTEWYKEIAGDLMADAGKTLEIGSGIGNFKQYFPGVISSDIQEAQWLDLCLDAHELPFMSGSIRNIVMIDVLHHLSQPLRFIYEAERVLMPGGRLVILEPYPSPVSLLIYRIFHPEPFIMNVDYFKNKNTGSASLEHVEHREPNQAAAYLLFYKQKEQFEKLFDRRMAVIKKKLFACVLYPLSGGFQQRAFIPAFMAPLAKGLDVLVAPLRFLLAFRCRIVIEKL